MLYDATFNTKIRSRVNKKLLGKSILTTRGITDIGIFILLSSLKNCSAMISHYAAYSSYCSDMWQQVNLLMHVIAVTKQLTCAE